MVGVGRYSLLLFFVGLSSLYVSVRANRTAIYRGEEEVFEGDPFEISCILSFDDSEGWTVNSSIFIGDDNKWGYVLSQRMVDKVREEFTLKVLSAQLYHEGEYRCNRFSRDYHNIKVIPLDGSEIETSAKKTSMLKTTHEYILEDNETYEFYCSSAKDENTPVTWYKNSFRILEKSHSNIFMDGLSLIIENASEDDAGEYMCTVDAPFVTGYTGIGKIFRLNSPPNIVEFRHRWSIQKKRLLELNCTAKGFPLPKLTWYIGNLMASSLKKEDHRISVYEQISPGIKVMSFLVVTDMHLSDKGLYTCRAENSIDSGSTLDFDEESAFVYVRENMIETNEDEPGLGKLLIPGEQLILYCNTTECAQCKVVWYKDGVLLQSGTDHIEMYKNNSLIIEDPSYNDTGIYMCAIDRNLLDIALNATINVQSKIKLDKFDQSAVVVQGSPLELFCSATGSPSPYIKWFIGDQEIFDDDERVKFLDHGSLKRGKLVIEEAEYEDRNYYTCEAYNQVNSVNSTVLIRIKGKLAALWPFLGICGEVAILCSIIFVYERRKSMNECDEPETDLPADDKHRDQKSKGQDIRQRK